MKRVDQVSGDTLVHEAFFSQFLGKPLLWVPKVFPLFAYFLSILVFVPRMSFLCLK